MATYSVTINEKTAKGKSILTILHSMSDIVDIVPQSPALKSMEVSLSELKKVKAGTMKGIPARNLLAEL